MKTIYAALLLGFGIFNISSCLAQAKPIGVTCILEMELHSSINPATYQYIESGLSKAQEKNCNLVLIRLNTPGGLISTTKDILSLFGKSSRPIVVWITPEGASATSAGAIISTAAHVLVMSEGTNMGAATPVQAGGKEIGKDMRNKAINDLSALIQSLSQARGRNPQGLEQIVSKAKSFGPQEALKQKFIDGIANSQQELLDFLEGKVIVFQGSKRVLELTNPQIIPFKMNLGQSLLNILAHPSLAYVLFLLGAALLYLELQAPGGLIAGSVGTLCLILSGIGFQVLPLNFGAFGLILASFVLFIMDIYIVSYGLLSLLGIGALTAGSLFLFKTENLYVDLGNHIVYSAVGAIALFLIFIGVVMAKTHKHIGRKKFNAMAGKSGTVLQILRRDGEHSLYQVKVGGELWQATSKHLLEERDFCRIVEQDDENMLLKIEKKES